MMCLVAGGISASIEAASVGPITSLTYSNFTNFLRSAFDPFQVNTNGWPLELLVTGGGPTNGATLAQVTNIAVSASMAATNGFTTIVYTNPIVFYPTNNPSNFVSAVIVTNIATSINNSITSLRNIRYYNPLGGTNDDTTVFQTAINSGIPTYVDPYTNYTVKNLYLSNNTVLMGNNTVIKFATNATGYLLASQPTNHDIFLFGLTLDGQKYGFTGVGQGDANSHAWSWAVTTPDITQVASVTNRSGFYLFNLQTNCTMSHCTAQGFSDAGFRVYGAGTFPTVNVKPLSLIDCNASASWLGFDVLVNAEYFAPFSCTTVDCGRGWNIFAGNVQVCGSLNIVDGVGFYIGNGGSNPGHSMISGSTINHCLVYGLFNTLPEGTTMSDCVMLGNGVLIITNCTGVIVQNSRVIGDSGTSIGALVGASIIVDGTAGAPYSGNNWFINNAIVGPITPLRANGGIINMSGFYQANGNIAIVDTNTVFGPILMPSIASGSLLRTASGSNVAAVTIGSNLSFDGTTLSASGGGTGLTNVFDSNFTSVGGTNIHLASSLNLTNASVAKLTNTSVAAFPFLLPSSLLRLDSNTNLAIVTIGSGLTFDGTTLTGTGSGTGLTNTFDQNQFTLVNGTNVHISQGATISNAILSSLTRTNYNSTGINDFANNSSWGETFYTNGNRVFSIFMTNNLFVLADSNSVWRMIITNGGGIFLNNLLVDSITTTNTTNYGNANYSGYNLVSSNAQFQGTVTNQGITYLSNANSLTLTVSNDITDLGTLEVAGIATLTNNANKISTSTLTNTGTLNLPAIASSSLLRTTTSSNVAAVTIGSGITFDGTTLSSTIVLGGITETNFISGQIYTNTSGSIQVISSSATLGVAAVNGNSVMALESPGNQTNFFASSTLITSIAMSYSNYLAVAVPQGSTYTFTNRSTGAGNTASIFGGQILTPGSFTYTNTPSNTGAINFTVTNNLTSSNTTTFYLTVSNDPPVYVLTAANNGTNFIIDRANGPRQKIAANTNINIVHFTNSQAGNCDGQVSLRIFTTNNPNGAVSPIISVPTNWNAGTSNLFSLTSGLYATTVTNNGHKIAWMTFDGSGPGTSQTNIFWSGLMGQP